MPFDDFAFPIAHAPERNWANRPADRRVAIWLGCVAFMIFVMIILGGATRLTGSGLSIMEWAPLSGALPPMSEMEWNRLFGLYKQIPQFALQNSDFTLADFQHIFWLEWTHRLWGRLLGVAFLAPLVWFAARGMIGRRMLPRLFLLFVLGGLQGAVGWFMVASGFLPDSTSVSPYRLVAHLALAVCLYAALVWMAMSAWPARSRPGASPAPRRLAAVTVALVGLTIVAGGFVAGNHAGLIYNSFPLMDGQLLPPDYAALTPFARNLFENVAAVQFDHRLLATLTAAAALATVAAGFALKSNHAARIAVSALGAAVIAQYALGVATLLNVVPFGLAVAHQAGAALLLTAALATLHSMRAVDAPAGLRE